MGKSQARRIIYVISKKQIFSEEKSKTYDQFPRYVQTKSDRADDLFQAGLEFYEKIGTYCVDFQRVIKFSKVGILEALDQAIQKT